MAPEDSPAEEAEQLAPYKIEAARSSRSRCRTCRRKIDKDKLRLGILLEGPYGTGYLWHHLTCAAKRRAEDVEAAYEAKSWDDGVEVPPLEELAKLREKAAAEKAKRKDPPYVERAPSGRSKCKHCGELIEKDSLRVALLREIVFGSQVRGTPIVVPTRAASPRRSAPTTASRRSRASRPACARTARVRSPRTSTRCWSRSASWPDARQASASPSSRARIASKRARSFASTSG